MALKSFGDIDCTLGYGNHLHMDFCKNSLGNPLNRLLGNCFLDKKLNVATLCNFFMKNRTHEKKMATIIKCHLFLL